MYIGHQISSIKVAAPRSTPKIGANNVRHIVGATNIRISELTLKY